MLKHALFLIVSALLLQITGCSESTEKTSLSDTKSKKDVTVISEKSDPWLQVLRSHTTGQISRFDSIDLYFHQDLPKSEMLVKNPALANQLLTFEPYIEGQGRLINQRHFRFTPNNPLPSGQNYRAIVSAEGIEAINESSNQTFNQTISDDFVFNISVIKQDFEIKMNGLTSNKNGSMRLQGELNTADAIDVDAIQNLVTASINNKKLKVEWDKELGFKNTHRFLINNIQRTDSVGTLNIQWDGDDIGVEKTGEHSYQVPAIGQFVISSITAIQGKSQTIEINFSEPLLQKQNLNGLIQVSTGTIKTRIEGAKITLYPNHAISGALEVSVDSSIKNAQGINLGKAVSKTLQFLSQTPGVRFTGEGHILPISDNLNIPIETINVDSIQVTAFQIQENSMAQYFQDNQLDTNYNLQRVGRYIWRKTVPLNNPKEDQWNRFNLDVRDLVINNPGSLFRFELSLNRSNSIVDCPAADKAIPVSKENPYRNYDDRNTQEQSGWDGIESYYNQNNNAYQWSDRENPCKDGFYQYNKQAKDKRSFIASNIGLIAKQGEDNKLVIIATELSSGLPLSGAQLEIKNYQNQTIGQVETDGDGFASLTLNSTPFLIVATSDNSTHKDVGYLKINKAQAISTSHFNVGGKIVKDGVKAQIYTERGVWRPGDKIFLTVAIEDKTDQIPENHPLMLELINPRNQRVSVQVNSKPVGGLYAFTLETDKDDETGNWKAIASLGSLKFDHTLKIEMVKPNHLKMNLDLANDDVRATKVGRDGSTAQLQGEFFSQWLHGAKASDLKGVLNLSMYPQKTRFDTFRDFQFDDPAKNFHSQNDEIASFQLDAEGKATIDARINIVSLPPGKLRGSLTSRVFEPSGDFSISKQSIDIHPYQQYVGMQMPKGDAARGMLLTDQKHPVELLVVDADGKRLQGQQQLSISLYKLSWKWWWDSSQDDQLANYVSRYSNSTLQQEDIELTNGKGTWEFEVKYPEWGRYMIRACDKKGQHCTGQVFYMDWPGWAGRDQNKKGLGANILSLSSDKEEYVVGETAIVTLPEAASGRALVSVENGSQVLDYYWAELSEVGLQLPIPITHKMTPNAYISVSVIQGHTNKNNDEPIRLMGILPITVSDPETHLNPQLTVADEVEPESTLTVEVNEEKGRRFSYTLALVDEGLLGLTQFKTPDLHKGFYQKEALGVRTWDLYDSVVGAYGAELEQLLAIGGDGDLGNKEQEKDERRFPPVVKFLGPFQLKENEVAQHKIDIPQYLGAVRVMLVAANDGAYGRSEKEVLVRKPLNLLATLPRVLGKDETLQMPVTLFTSDDAIKDVTVSIQADDKISLLKTELNVQFDKSGERMVFVPMRALKLGISKVEIIATAKTTGKKQEETFVSKQTIHIPVNAQTSEEKRYKTAKLQAGESWNETAEIFGIEGTQNVELEFTTMPPMNLQNHLQYLLGYPHGCVEQTTSKALPQLFLPELTNLSDEQLVTSQNNIAAAIDKLSRHQVSSGGFSYWPGTGRVNDWSSSYAGHFLLLAKDHGYDVPTNMLNGWQESQSRVARAWSVNTQSNHSHINSYKAQAYRLFTLALSGNSEMGAMNRFRQYDDLDNLSRWLLAAAYQLSGQQQAAQMLAQSADFVMNDYVITDYSFGSTLRDEAMLLMSLLVLDDDKNAAMYADKISQQLAKNKERYSTQTTAFSLLAMSAYSQKNQSNGSQVSIVWQNHEQLFELEKAINLLDLNVNPKDSTSAHSDEFKVINNGTVPVYAQLMSQGIPELGKEQPYNNELALNVSYFDGSKERSRTPIDLDTVTQGQDILVVVHVKNESLYPIERLALTVPVASGFEIRNTDSVDGIKTTNDVYEFQDIRDDKIYTYFNLGVGESKELEFRINATYQGRYYQSAVVIYDMYDERRTARNAGHWVEIAR